MLDPEITVGNLLTACSVLISATALLIAWKKEHQLQKRKHADEIRHNAGALLARLERWQELALSFFYDVDFLITEADMLLIEKNTIYREQRWDPIRDSLNIGP